MDKKVRAEVPVKSAVSTGGYGGANIRIKTDIGVQDAGGKVLKHLPDGTVVPGNPDQEFVRLDAESCKRLARGDWLLNPMTHETHKVERADEDGVWLTTTEGSTHVPWGEIPDLLLLVVNV